MNHAITGDGTILEPPPADQPAAILTASGDIPEGLTVVLGHDIPIPDDDEPPPATAFERELIGTLADLCRVNTRLTAELDATQRAIAVLVRERVNQPPAANGDVVDRAHRYGHDLDTGAAVERIRERCHNMLNVGERFIEIGAVLRLLASHHNATAGTPQ